MWEFFFFFPGANAAERDRQATFFLSFLFFAVHTTAVESGEMEIAPLRTEGVGGSYNITGHGRHGRVDKFEEKTMEPTLMWLLCGRLRPLVCLRKRIPLATARWWIQLGAAGCHMVSRSSTVPRGGRVSGRLVETRACPSSPLWGVA